MLTIETAVKAASLFVEKRNTMPVLATIACNGTIRATNLETSIELNKGSDFVGCYTKQQLEISLSSGQTVKPYCHLDEFPETKFSPDVLLGMGTLEGIAEMLEPHLRTASTDETRYNICGVHFTPDNRIQSTDGHRLFISDSPLASLPEGFILPRGGVEKLVKLAKLFKRETVTCSVGFNQFRKLWILTSEAFTLTLRCLDAVYPDTDCLFNGKKEEFVSSIHTSFLSSLKAQTSNRKEKELDKGSTRGKQIPIMTEVHIRRNGTASVMQDFGVVIPIVMLGDMGDSKEITILRREYLIDALEQVGEGAIFSRLGERMGAVKIQGAKGVALVMPIRTK